MGESTEGRAMTISPPCTTPAPGSAQMNYGEFAIRLERARIEAANLNADMKLNHDSVAMNPTHYQPLLADMLRRANALAKTLRDLLDAVPAPNGKD
jgi:hypothetical protein